MKKLETLIPPPLLMIIVAVAMRLARGFLVGTLGIDDTLRYAIVGLVLLVAGLFGGPAIARFRKAGTTIDPVHVDRASKLVTDGIYQYSRNPMYVGLTALLVAWGLHLNHALLLAGPFGFALYIRWFQIRPEEAAMRSRFGSAFDEYCMRTRRWV